MAIDDGRATGGRPAAPARFSASDAAFTGLRLLTREPRTWLIWSGLFLLLSLAFGVLTVTTAGPAMTQMMAAGGVRPDPAASLALIGRLAPFYAITLVVSLAFYAVAFAAVNRAVLRPTPARFAHLALGADELRQLIVLLLIGLVLLGVYIAALIVGALVAVGVALATSALHAGDGLASLMVVLVALLVLGTAIFVTTRLSLASPLTLDTGRVDLGASWRMTRGRFWALFGAYVLAGLVAVVIFVIVGVLFAAVALTTGGGLRAAGVLFRPDMTSLQAYFGPMQIVWTVVNAALSPLLFALMLGAPAGAYAQLTAMGLGPATPRPAGATPASDLPRFGR